MRTNNNVYASLQSEINVSDKSYPSYQSNQSFGSHSHQYQSFGPPSSHSHSHSNQSLDFFKKPPRYQKYLGANPNYEHKVGNAYHQIPKTLINEDIKTLTPKKRINENGSQITPKKRQILKITSNSNECETKWDNEPEKKKRKTINGRNANNSVLCDNKNKNKNHKYEASNMHHFRDEDRNIEEARYDHDEDWNDSSIVCKFYNPYFDSGCRQKQCEYAHLSQEKYSIYCRVLRNQNQMDSYSQRKYEDAISYIKSGFITDALNIFRHLVTDYEYNAYCNFWLGRCYQLFENATFKDLECAEFYYQKAIALHPNNATFHSRYAEFMVFLASRKKKETECFEHKRAKIHIEKAMKLKPSDLKYTLQYAKFLDCIDGEFVEAKKYYKLALESCPFDCRIRLNYARLLHKMGNFRAAKQEFGVIFDISNSGRQPHEYHTKNTKWIWPHFHYAKLLVDMRYFKVAKDEFELCVEIMEERNYKYFSDIYYEFGKLLFTHLNDNEYAYYCMSQAKLNAPHKNIYDKLLYTIENAYYHTQSSDSDSPTTF